MINFPPSDVFPLIMTPAVRVPLESRGGEVFVWDVHVSCMCVYTVVGYWLSYGKLTIISLPVSLTIFTG